MADFVMINNYLIDVAIREDHQFQCDVTDYPVESGGSLSDNIRPKPITVTMDGIVSNSPLGTIATARRTFAGPLATGEASAAEAYALLLAVWNAREPVTIRTSLGTFERMALTSLSIPKSKDTGDALHFTASFQQIQVVTNARIRVRKAIRNGGGRRDLGAKAATGRSPKFFVWRKGQPPGSYFITSTEIVWFKAQNTGAGRQDSAEYYHFDAETVLSSPELAAFELDMARDRRDAEAARRKEAGNEALKKLEYLQQLNFVEAPPPASTLSRKPVANMSNRARVQLKDGAGFDPAVNAFKRPFQ